VHFCYHRALPGVPLFSFQGYCVAQL
jgi:hypothetical protein